MTDILKQFLEISVMASIMIGIVLVIRQIFSKKMNPAVMLLLWGIVLIRLTLPFTFASPVRLADLFPDQAYSADRNGGTVPANNQAPAMNPALNSNANPTGINAQPAIRQKTSQKPAEAAPDETTVVSLSELCKNIPWWSVFAAIWAAGIAATLFVSIWKAARFRRKLQFCNPVADRTVLRFIQIHKKETGLKKAVAALECDFVHAPAVFGYFKPCILIPSRFINEMDTDSLDAILLHEIYHIRCHDILTNYIWLAAKALHWFNPLVWFAYKWFEYDLELRRDQNAAQRLKADGTFVYSKSLLEAARFSRQKAEIPSTAAALFEKKCKLKQRIVRLVKPQKRTKSAAIVSALLSIVMIVACFTTACQPTPETQVVVQKDMEQMKKVMNNPAEKTLFEMVDAPKELQLSVMNGNGTVAVNANAQVLMPEAEGITIKRVRKHKITQDEADRILQYFIGSAAFNNGFESKDDVYIEMLMRFKAELAAETDPQKRAQLQASIDKFEKAGITASDGTKKIAPASKVFTESKLGGQRIEGYSKTQDSYRFLQIVNNPDMNEYRVLYTSEQNGFAADHGTYYDEYSKSNMNKMGFNPEEVSRLPLSVTAEQARYTASQALRELGLKDMTLAYCSEVWGGTFIENGVAQGRHAYSLEYVRQVNGVPITYSEFGIETGSLVETDDGGYAAQWPYERVHFIIDDTGIDEFIWESPYDLAETVTEHSAIMSFNKIQSVFERMMPITNAYTGNQGTKITFDITRVQFGLMRITEKDSTDTALLIPVWDFFGTYTVDDGTGKLSVNKDINTSRLTINAIDGSVVDRGLGY